MFDFAEMPIQLAKLLLAGLLGAAVGFERERHGQAAGLRTNTLVALTGCLLMMISLHVAILYDTASGVGFLRIDPARIASYAIAGMGFLGSGVVLTGKGSIRGLTTATGLWLMTAVGMCIGAGFAFPAVFTTVLAILFLYRLRNFKLLMIRDEYTTLGLTCIGCEDPLHAVRDVLARRPQIEIRFVACRFHVSVRMSEYRIRLRSRGRFPWKEISCEIEASVPGLTRISLEESDVP